MRPSLDDMIVFRSVVDARSFTLAAERLGRAKSAVSQIVSRLEADLNCRLLYRTTRALSLTEAGARFFAHCSDLQRAYDRAVADLSVGVTELSGTLAVTTPHALSAVLVAPAMELFLSRHPKMRIRMIAADEPVDLIEARIDLALRVGLRAGQTARIVTLGTLGECLYASPQYVERAGGMPPDLNALASWDHIANEWQGDPVTYRLGDADVIRVSPRIRCNTAPDILRLTEQGLGVALLPDLVARQAVAAGRLVRLHRIDATAVNAVHNFASIAPRKVTDFIGALREVLRGEPALSKGH